MAIVTTQTDFNSLLRQFSGEAADGCGSVFEVFNERFCVSVERAAAEMTDSDRVAFLLIAWNQYDYDPKARIDERDEVRQPAVPTSKDRTAAVIARLEEAKINGATDFKSLYGKRETSDPVERHRGGVMDKQDVIDLLRERGAHFDAELKGIGNGVSYATHRLSGKRDAFNDLADELAERLAKPPSRSPTSA